MCVLFDPSKLDPLFYGLSRKIVVKPRSSSDLGLGLFAHKEYCNTESFLYRINMLHLLLAAVISAKGASVLR